MHAVILTRSKDHLLEKQKLYKLGIFPQGTKSWLSAMCNSLNKQGIFLQGPNTKVHKNPV